MQGWFDGRITNPLSGSQLMLCKHFLNPKAERLYAYTWLSPGEHLDGEGERYGWPYMSDRNVTYV